MATRRPNAYTQSLQEAQKKAEQEKGSSELTKQQDSKTPEQPDGQMAKQQNIQASVQPNVETVRQENSQTVKHQRIKATFYLEPEDIIAIDEMQTKRFKQHNKKPEKSELVSEAIQLLYNQLNS